MAERYVKMEDGSFALVTRKKRESKGLTKDQKSAIRLLRSAQNVNVTFNGIAVKVNRASAIDLVEKGKAAINAVLHGDTELSVSLRAVEVVEGES